MQIASGSLLPDTDLRGEPLTGTERCRYLQGWLPVPNARAALPRVSQYRPPYEPLDVSTGLPKQGGLAHSNPCLSLASTSHLYFKHR